MNILFVLLFFFHSVLDLQRYLVFSNLSLPMRTPILYVQIWSCHLILASKAVAETLPWCFTWRYSLISLNFYRSLGDSIFIQIQVSLNLRLKCLEAMPGRYLGRMFWFFSASQPQNISLTSRTVCSLKEQNFISYYKTSIIQDVKIKLIFSLYALNPTLLPQQPEKKGYFTVGLTKWSMVRKLARKK